MDILIISGTLGAGKTRFIGTFIKKINKKIALLENELAEVSLDSDILSDEVETMDLSQGCACCSAKADFANSVLSISNSIEPELLIIEPTGIAFLSKLISNLQEIEYERIRILSPIVIVDAGLVDYHISENDSIFIDQIMTSGKIILSKTEDMGAEEIERAISLIKEVKEDAEIISNHYDGFEDSFWTCFYNEKLTDRISGSDIKTPEIESVSFVDVSFEKYYTFTSYVNALIGGRFGNIKRIKGILSAEDKWFKIDYVEGKLTILESEPIQKSKLIVIGENLEKNNISILLGTEVYSKKVEIKI